MRSPITLTLIAGVTVSIAATTPAAYRYLGRVNPKTNELTWPSSGVAFDFTGTSATVPITVTGDNAIDVVVDGKAPVIINEITGNSISTPAGLANGKHTVEIRKKSETSFGSIFFRTPTASSGKTTAPAAPKKRIEFIGDSITVGYGLDGTYPCVNTAALEDAPKTYGALTAKNLSADYSIIAWSGKGVIRNYVQATVDTSPTMPELWTRYGANDADNSYDFSYQPQIVVINLGTNDWSYLLFNSTGGSYAGRPTVNVTQFTNALYSFAKTVQTKYNYPQMFLTSSPLLGDSYPTTADAQHTTQANAVKAVVAKLGSKAHFVDFPSQDTNAVGAGCDYHPSAAEHQIMAAILTTAIKQVTV
ncbi:hypothetical protein LTR86_007483 [Recurvomyces mirabilis]|nr:hypothetical protein LTR86_007483 [Recurvomyces mirabilis]